MLLQVRDLGIAYGKGDPVVRHVSFDLDAGQVLAIVGESGSGENYGYPCHPACSSRRRAYC